MAVERRRGAVADEDIDDDGKAGDTLEELLVAACVDDILHSASSVDASSL